MLLGDSATATDGHELFLQCLPENVRMILASPAEDRSLEKIAQHVGKIIDDAPPAVSAVTPLATTVHSVETLRAEIDKLHKLNSTLDRVP